MVEESGLRLKFMAGVAYIDVDRHIDVTGLRLICAFSVAV
jgi:hypothetical protein